MMLWIATARPNGPCTPSSTLSTTGSRKTPKVERTPSDIEVRTPPSAMTAQSGNALRFGAATVVTGEPA